MTYSSYYCKVYLFQKMTSNNEISSFQKGFEKDRPVENAQDGFIVSNGSINVIDYANRIASQPGISFDLEANDGIWSITNLDFDVDGDGELEIENLSFNLDLNEIASLEDEVNEYYNRKNEYNEKNVIMTQVMILQNQKFHSI